jgi:hypothetical protein
MFTIRFWNNLYQVSLNTEILESLIIQVFGSNKTKGPKQDSQNRQLSHTDKHRQKGGGFVCFVRTFDYDY